MLTFEKSSVIKAPVEVVWAFHERLDILDLLTPPWQPVQVVRREGGLGIGAITEFRIWLGPLPVKWLARHIECEPYRLFCDRQAEGPLDHWIHRHQFEPLADTTRLTDSIEFALPGGEPVEDLIGGFVGDRLRDMFDYRHQVTQDMCGVEANHVAS
jgi:ligand-binding SRPBCC domain-containing protein